MPDLTKGQRDDLRRQREEWRAMSGPMNIYPPYLEALLDAADRTERLEALLETIRTRAARSIAGSGPRTAERVLAEDILVVVGQAIIDGLALSAGREAQP